MYFLMHKRYQLMLNKILVVVNLGDWIWEDFLYILEQLF